MNAPELLRSVKDGHCPAVIFLYGEEEFLVDQCLRRLKDLLIAPENRDFNLGVFYARDTSAAVILETLRTYPVFSERRVVIVKDAQHLGAADLDRLQDYLQDPVPEGVLICVCDKVDGRRKFFQTLKKKGALIEFRPLYDNKIPSYVRDQLRQDGYEMTEDAAGLFCRRVGSNLREINAELGKLYTFVGGRTLVDVADVEAVVSDTRTDNVFALMEAVGSAERSQALVMLNRMLNDGAAPLMILSMLVRHYRQLWKAVELLEQGGSRKEMPKVLGVNPFFLDGILRQARTVGGSRCRKAFELFIETDLALKSSGANPRALMEQLLLKLVTSGEGRA